jgi:hypothetical protein
MNNKYKYLINNITALILIIFGFFYYLSSLANSFLSLFFVSLGFFILIFNILKLNNFSAGIEQDERTKKISQISLSYSWLFSFVVLNFIFFLNYFELISFDFNALFSVMILSMIVSVLFSRMVFRNKNI